MNPIESAVRKIDAVQQKHAVTAFTFGVIKKFGDDRGGALAALIAYYGFLSLFPLLLLIVTAIGIAAGRNPAFQNRLLHSALVDFPIIGVQIQSNIHALRANGVGLLAGLIGLVWGGLGVTQAGQFAMQEVWNVPGVRRPNFVTRIERGVAILALVAVGVGITSALAGVGSQGSHTAPLRVVTFVASAPCNVLSFWLGYAILTGRRVPMRAHLPGSVAAGLAWTLLQGLGGYLVAHQLRHASQVYGFFGVVLGLLSWLFLLAQVTIYCAEINAVRVQRLWPRSIVQPPLTAQDERALESIARREERRPEESVDVRFRRGAS